MYWLTVVSSLSLFGLVTALAIRRPRIISEWFLIVGLTLIGAEQMTAWWSVGTYHPATIESWTYIRFFLAALALGSWLAIAVTFGRAFPGEFLRTWKWGIGLLTLVGVGAVVVPLGAFIYGSPVWISEEGGRWVTPLGNRGAVFNVTFLVGLTLVLAGFEKTYRYSLGKVRWQIKFAVLGAGAYGAARIYTSSQALLYRAWSTDLDAIHAVAALVLALFFFVSLRRSRTLDFEIYPSAALLRGSFTMVAVGGYLIAVGLLVKLLQVFGISLDLQGALIFGALSALAALLISDRLREAVALFTRRHFRRPTYDYRQVWTRFNLKLANCLDEREVAKATAEILSNTVKALSVSVWEIEPGGKRRLLAGTAGNHSRDDAGRRRSRAPGESGIRKGPDAEVGRRQPSMETVPFNPMSPSGTRDVRREEVPPGHPASLHLAGQQGNGVPVPSPGFDVFPLRVGDELQGEITVSGRFGGKPLTLEDRELIEVLADQTAAVLMNIRLARKVREASEMQAFQNMSTFVLHDLKNLANRLSLTVQNLPRHFDNPEFREEALRTISGSVEKIKGLCSRLSLIRDRLEVTAESRDLQEFTRNLALELQAEVGDRMKLDLHPTGLVRLDPGQFRKVIVNLVLNAVEAVNDQAAKTSTETRESLRSRSVAPESVVRTLGNGFPISRGTVAIATYKEGDSTILEVADAGCGMSAEFIESRLFQPFQTTKREGMGIGLFQSKMIVEALGGKIEVESEPGEGSSFIVRLPAV